MNRLKKQVSRKREVLFLHMLGERGGRNSRISPQVLFIDKKKNGRGEDRK